MNFCRTKFPEECFSDMFFIMPWHKEVNVHMFCMFSICTFHKEVNVFDRILDNVNNLVMMVVTKKSEVLDGVLQYAIDRPDTMNIPCESQNLFCHDI